jgi:DEAD/DEAH box helicase domain-containing protein
VESLDLEAREVLVSPADPPYYTQVTGDKETEILQVTASLDFKTTKVHLGRLRVTETVTGFKKILSAGQKMIGYTPLDLPPQIFETEGIWIEVPPTVQHSAEKQQMHFMGGIHAMEHALIGMMPMLVLCDRNDIGGISYPFHPEVNSAAVFIYDGYPGGVGLCQKGFGDITRLLGQTLQAVAACDCELGCPSCVHSPKCGSGNRPIDKNSCIFIMQELLSGQRGAKPIPLHHSKTAQRSSTADQKECFDPAEIRYGVFDVETRRSAKEVGGWHRAEKMGISVAVLYVAQENRFYNFEEDAIQQLIDHLFTLDLVVGFNNKRFDNRVLSAYTSRKLNRLPNFDLLDLIKGQLGYRLSLDRLAEHTLGVMKSGDGLQALQWFKEGKMELLTRYCRQDVEITRDLFLYGLAHKHLLFQNKAGKVVRLPVNFDRDIAALLLQY